MACQSTTCSRLRSAAKRDEIVHGPAMGRLLRGFEFAMIAVFAVIIAFASSPSVAQASAVTLSPSGRLTASDAIDQERSWRESLPWQRTQTDDACSAWECRDSESEGNDHTSRGALAADQLASKSLVVSYPFSRPEPLRYGAKYLGSNGLPRGPPLGSS